MARDRPAKQRNIGRAPRGALGRVVAAAGMAVVALMLLACLGSLPWTLARMTPPAESGVVEGHRGVQPRRYEAPDLDAALLPPYWAPHAPDERRAGEQIQSRRGAAPRSWLGTDRLGRSMLARCLAGGVVSLGIGLTAACIAVTIGTLYGTAAGAAGPKTDAAMMRIVDVIYGLPYILLVVLLAVAMDGLLVRVADNVSTATRQMVNVATLMVAIGGVSWLTLARVVRGQVLSLKQQPFMEACRAIGVGPVRQFRLHLLPNLLGPITVYAALTVPTAILAESFLSFLGIGVAAPLPSWGNLAADGLNELNIVRVRWWLLLWPCLFIAMTLVAMNFVGEWLRERMDVRQVKRRTR